MKRLFYTILFTMLLFMVLDMSRDANAPQLGASITPPPSRPAQPQPQRQILQKDGWVRWGGVEQQLYLRKGQTVILKVEKDGIVFLTAQ